jgi:hypothetical protein
MLCQTALWEGHENFNVKEWDLVEGWGESEHDGSASSWKRCRRERKELTRDKEGSFVKRQEIGDFLSVVLCQTLNVARRKAGYA